MDALFTIQQELNAPKGQYNSFGKYRYRSCEDILAAVKPLLGKTNSTLNLSDEIVAVGPRIYVRATATLTCEDGKTHSATGYAKEEETKKGMDGAQITGATSSYARKYALNGLFAIDDEKDTDATNAHEADTATTTAANQSAESLLPQALAEISAVNDEQGFIKVWTKWSTQYPSLCTPGTHLYKAGVARHQQINQAVAK